MIKKITLSVFAIAICLGVSSFKAEKKIANDADVAGWYADGIKVTSISCYNFTKLQLVVPYNAEWAQYTNISIKFFKNEKENQGAVKIIPLSSITSFIQGNYLVFTFFAEGEKGRWSDYAKLVLSSDYDAIPNLTTYPEEHNDFLMNRFSLKYDLAGAKKDHTPTEDLTLNFSLFGLMQTGVDEKYSEAYQSVRKTPIYTSTKLTKTFKLTCTSRTFTTEKNMKADEFKDPCAYEGTKLDIK